MYLKLMVEILLCSFGTFDSDIHIFDSHGHNMVIIQEHYSINLCIVLHLSHEHILKIFEVKTPNTDVIAFVTSPLLMKPVILLQNCKMSKL